MSLWLRWLQAADAIVVFFFLKFLHTTFYAAPAHDPFRRLQLPDIFMVTCYDGKLWWKKSNGQLLWLILQQRSLPSRQVKHSEATPQSSTANVYIRTSHHKLMGVAPQRWRQKDAKGAFQAVRKVDSRFFRLWHHLQAWQWHGAYRWLLLRELRISQFCICLPGMPLCCARCSWQDMLFKLKVGLRDSKLAHSWPPMRRKVCSLLPFPLLDGALPQSHTSLGCGIPFPSEAKHQSHVCKSAY